MRAAPAAARAEQPMCWAGDRAMNSRRLMGPLAVPLFYGGLWLGRWSLTSNLQGYQSEAKRHGKSLGKI